MKLSYSIPGKIWWITNFLDHPMYKGIHDAIIKERKKGIIYSVNSWDGYFYNHTNENAEDFKIERCKDLSSQNWKTFIPAKDEVLIGGLVFLKDWIIRSETSNALSKLII